MIKEVVVLSGKGGTGKTIVTSSLAVMIEDVVSADCDVDAANLGLLLEHEVVSRDDFFGGRMPGVDYDLCTGCGICADHCRFNAIDEKIRVDPVSCEHCGLCARVCPEQAIELVWRRTGEVFISQTTRRALVHARLGPAEENSGKLVSEVRNRARRIAAEEGVDLVVIDGPPGIGCPVISALTGVQLVVAVTEPTYSGLHDLRRLLGLTAHFEIPTAMVLNRCDISAARAADVEQLCRDEGLPLLGSVPFDRKIVDAVVKGVPPVLTDSEAAGELRRISGEVEMMLRPQPRRFVLSGRDL